MFLLGAAGRWPAVIANSSFYGYAVSSLLSAVKQKSQALPLSRARPAGAAGGGAVRIGEAIRFFKHRRADGPGPDTASWQEDVASTAVALYLAGGPA